MKIAFALYKYFPYGGLQRDMLRIAQLCVKSGAAVTIYCSDWQGEKPDGIAVEMLAVQAGSNHQRNRKFFLALQARLQQSKHDLLVGFNKMPGLDVYYAADTCFKAKVMQERLPLLRFLPRYRQFLRDEEAVFANGHTQILAIAWRSVDEYEQYYAGCSVHCTVLPPGINPDRRAGDNALSRRAAFRKTWRIAEQEKLVLMIGSGFRTKGVDRAIRALAALPQDVRSKTRMMIVGQDNPAAFQKLARQLAVDGRIEFLAGRDDIPDFLQGADVLIHPAYREAAGIVLLEAAVAGLPVLTTAVCGYSYYIREYDCGTVIDEPFSQQQLDEALASLLRDDARRAVMRENGLSMAATADIYSLHERAAAIIMRIASERDA